jgi:Peptidase family M23
MTTAPTPTIHRHSYISLLPGRAWGFGVLAFAWYGLSTFVLPLPSFVTVFVLGLLVMLTLAPDSQEPSSGIAPTRRNLVLALLALAAFVPVALGMDLLLGTIPIKWGPQVVGAFAALCVLIPRFAEAREFPRTALLGHRELIVAVTAVVAFARSYQAGDLFLAIVALVVFNAPVVMAIRRFRFGASSPRQLGRRNWALQAANFWIFLTLLAAAALAGTLSIWKVFAPDAESLIAGAFWIGLLATALLVAFPRRRISVAANLLVALGSIFLAVQLVRIHSEPTDAVTIGVPFADEWYVASGGRSALVNSHWSLNVQRDAIDFVQLVDGKPYRGDKSRLESYYIYGDPLVAVADGRVTEAIDSIADAPVGGRTWEEMAGNHVVLDIGDGHYVLYGHMKQGSLRVHAGDHVRRGQLIGQVGDSGNSDTPHLHIQVQNKPTFDVESREARTYPILFEDATITDPRRGDSVSPVAGTMR